MISSAYALGGQEEQRERDRQMPLLTDNCRSHFQIPSQAQNGHNSVDENKSLCTDIELYTIS